MNSTDKFLLSIFLLLGVTLGLSFAKIYPNIPFFEWDNKVDVVSLFGVIVTAAIGIGIPLFLKKLIDDNRSIKSLLTEEVKELIATICEIRVIFSTCYERGKISPVDKDKVNYIFHRAELQIASIEKQLNISFQEKAAPVVKEMKEKYFEYHNHTTGGPLMNSKYTVVEDDFRRGHDTLQSNFITHLKGVLHTIHKF